MSYAENGLKAHEIHSSPILTEDEQRKLAEKRAEELKSLEAKEEKSEKAEEMNFEEQLAEKDRQYAEMKAEYEKRLAEKDAFFTKFRDAKALEAQQKHAENVARIGELQGHLDAEAIEIERLEDLLASTKSLLQKSEAATKENETLKARVAELEAAAKTAEQIAAEKYGAALPLKTDDPAAVDIDKLKAEWNAVKTDPGLARQRFLRNLSDAQFKALFG